jgi:N-ethylmaleimide reductase
MPAAAPFIANPNLVERLRSGTPLAPLASETLSGGDQPSYADSPTLAA